MYKIVDIMPNISPTGDFKRISDDDTYNNNNKVATLFNLLEYGEGKSSLFPEMGVNRLLNSIPYSEHPEEVVSQISMKISSFLNFPVSVDYDWKDETKEIMIIKLTIAGLPGEIQVGAKKNGENIRLLSPKYLK